MFNILLYMHYYAVIIAYFILHSSFFYSALSNATLSIISLRCLINQVTPEPQLPANTVNLLPDSTQQGIQEFLASGPLNLPLTGPQLLPSPLPTELKQLPLSPNLSPMGPQLYLNPPHTARLQLLTPVHTAPPPPHSPGLRGRV